MYRNPTRNYPIWDSVLFEAVRGQERLENLLNCSVNDVEMASDKQIKAVTDGNSQVSIYDYKIL